MDTLINGNSGDSAYSSSSSGGNLKPSVLVIGSILFTTLLISIFICFLLRYLNRRGHRQSLPSSSHAAAATDSRRVPVRRVSPNIAESPLVDSLPVFKYSSVTRRSSSANSGDCAVCLSKFEPHDQLRLLPLCCHAFHADCIDTWLASNQTCPLCRSPLFAAESEPMKSLDNGNIDEGREATFRLEIGSVSRRQPIQESGEQQRSYSMGSFDYIVDDDESEVSATEIHQRNTYGKEEESVTVGMPPYESRFAADVTDDSRNWWKDYTERFSRTGISSNPISFRSSGSFGGGNNRRTPEELPAEETEASRAGEEISELFRWLSGM